MLPKPAEMKAAGIGAPMFTKPAEIEGTYAIMDTLRIILVSKPHKCITLDFFTKRTDDRNMEFVRAQASPSAGSDGGTEVDSSTWADDTTGGAKMPFPCMAACKVAITLVEANLVSASVNITSVLQCSRLALPAVCSS